MLLPSNPIVPFNIPWSHTVKISSSAFNFLPPEACRPLQKFCLFCMLYSPRVLWAILETCGDDELCCNNKLTFLPKCQVGRSCWLTVLRPINRLHRCMDLSKLCNNNRSIFMRIQDIQKDLAQSRLGIKSKRIARLPVHVEKVAM